MVIAIDCDGVLADFTAEVVSWASNSDCRYDNISEFDILRAWGCPERQAELDAHCARPGFVLDMQPIEDSQVAIDWLRKDGHDVVVVTSPYEAVPTWQYERLLWLEKHFDIKPKDVIFTNRKELIKAALLIDDAQHNLRGFQGGRWLIRHPWNHAAVQGADYDIEFPSLFHAAKRLIRE